jgi:NADH:ubiquinone oxidoreductase subunit F (NADH-binding)
MVMVTRVLDQEPVTSLGDYQAMGGGNGLVAARESGPEVTLAVLDASGLRGRGGAGFPTGAKWRTIASYLTDAAPATVVVNAAEGEPGTFKDRALLRANPYRVLEGALIAATTIGADQVVVATKQRFTEEVARLRRAASEIRMCGWADEIAIDVVEGPDEYLFGEETALLEVVAGRPPFPRLTPPWRRGIDQTAGEARAGGAPAAAELGGMNDGTDVPPTLVNNVETMAHVAMILANGEDWFREVGTEASPGTIVCTISGDTERAGVAEVAMGTPLREVIDAVGGPVEAGIGMVLPGVSNRILPPDLLDVPLTYEALAEIDSGLGTGGFVVVGADVHPVAVAHGVSRFLAVESCGQCTPCKGDGLRIAEGLERIRTRQPRGEDEYREVLGRLGTVEDEARCFLASQHRMVIVSLLRLFSDEVRDVATYGGDEIDPYLVTELLDIRDGRAVYDEQHAAKQPDWTFDEVDSGQYPADRLRRHPIRSG